MTMRARSSSTRASSRPGSTSPGLWAIAGGSMRLAGTCKRRSNSTATTRMPIFNLAKLEFDAGNLSEARRRWARYLELDNDSEWARTAARGVQFVDLQFIAKTAG